MEQNWSGKIGPNSAPDVRSLGVVKSEFPIIGVDVRVTSGACTYDVHTGRVGGGTPKADESTDKLRECVSNRGVKKTKFFADVICLCPLCWRQLYDDFNRFSLGPPYLPPSAPIS